MPRFSLLPAKADKQRLAHIAAELMTNQLDDYKHWLADFRQRFIKAKGWSEKDVKQRIKDGYVCVREGRIQELPDGDKLPAAAVPVFYVLTPGEWKLPLMIHERLTGLVTRALTSDNSPKDIVLGLLAKIEHPEGEHESKEIQQKRHSAAFWGEQLLDAWKDPGLSSVIESDAFWQAILSAFQAGRRLTIIELYQTPQLLADLIRAQAFGSGRSPDELTKRLTKSYLELRAEHGRSPKLKEVAKAAGGKWSNTEACWLFDELTPVTPRGLCERLKDIHRKYPV
jgi:hypothetical protein